MKILTEYALSFAGTPYIYGGKNRLIGIDCSGLVEELLKSAGADPTGVQNSQMLYNILKDSTCKRQPGALAFYGKSLNEISHVAMMIDYYRIIEAGGGDHTTTSFEEAKKRGAMVRVRPVDHRADLQVILWPKYPFIPKEN